MGKIQSPLLHTRYAAFTHLITISFLHVFFLKHLSLPPLIQAPLTVRPPQTKTVPYSPSKSITTPLYSLTWRQTPQRTTTSPVQTGTRCGSRSRFWKNNLRLLWCLERARLEKGRTPLCSPAVRPIAHLNPTAVTAALSCDGAADETPSTASTVIPQEKWLWAEHEETCCLLTSNHCTERKWMTID